ncbi:NADP-dependent oxidoreductase [Candidatus Poribacteria bacterium]|nr:NADP-dependent oxidoreductase [Candidatus Poribacteria bacterium]
MSNTNRKITLAARPVGYPKDSDFLLVSEPIPMPKDGQILIRTHYLSVDPYQRGRMNAGRSYTSGVELGHVMTGGIVGDVTESKNPDFQVGEIVEGTLGWQEYAISDGSNVRKVDPSLAPISTALGVLGMPGLTAYFGLLEICQPKAGETVFVSGAAGAVGSTVGQIAKMKGCHVVGTAGSDEKINYVVNELGFDGAFHYKTVEDYDAKIKALCPDGIDCYFDNVGGAITDAVFPNLNLRARISICGQISQYNLKAPELGPRQLGHFIAKRLRMEGFLVFDFVEKHEEARRQMAQWQRLGKLKYRETITEGIENAPQAFMGLFRGDNIGKQLVKVYHG